MKTNLLHKLTNFLFLNKHHANTFGFSLIEVIVSISLFVIIILLVNSIYILAQQTYNKNSNLAELTQNARVSLDRLSREIRQSVSVITILPATDTDPLNPPTNQIFFQDGHNISQITYLRYYLNGTDLMRQKKVYYFSEEPDTYVTYNSIDQYGQPAQELILEDQVVGQYFNDLKFWGVNGLINISIGLSKSQNFFNIKTSVYSRNW